MMTPGARHDPRGPFIRLFVNRWYPALKNAGFSSQMSGAMLLTGSALARSQREPTGGEGDEGTPPPSVERVPLKSYYLDGGTGLVRIIPHQMNDVWWSRASSGAADGSLFLSDFTLGVSGDASLNTMPGLRLPESIYPRFPWTNQPNAPERKIDRFTYPTALRATERKFEEIFNDMFGGDDGFPLNDYRVSHPASSTQDKMGWTMRTTTPLNENEGVAIRMSCPSSDAANLANVPAVFIMLGDRIVVEIAFQYVGIYVYGRSSSVLEEDTWYPMKKFDMPKSSKGQSFTTVVTMQGKDCISIWRSGDAKESTDSPSTSIGGSWALYRMESQLKSQGLVYWNGVEGHWVKTPATPMSIGFMAVRYNSLTNTDPMIDEHHVGVNPFVMQLSRVRYILPEFQYSAVQELLDPLEVSATNLTASGSIFANPGGDLEDLGIEVSAVSGETLLPVVNGETYAALAMKWRLVPSRPWYSPDLAWLELSSPSVLLEKPEGHKEYTCSQQWAVIRFKRSAEDAINKGDLKIIGQPDGLDSEGQPTYKLNEDNIFQCLTTAEVTIARADSEGSGALLIDHDWAASLHVEERNPVIKNGQMFDSIECYDLLKRLEDATMGNIKVMNDITVERLMTHLCTRAGIHEHRVYIHDNIRKMPMMGTQVPGEFINSIASRSPLAALKTVIEKLVPYIRVRNKRGIFPAGYIAFDGTSLAGQIYDVEIYLRPGYRDTNTQIAALWKMYDINEVADPENDILISGGVDHTDYWHRSALRILKTREPIEFNVKGAKFHRLSASATVKPSVSENKKITSVFDRHVKFWEDPESIDYEMGFKKNLYESSPDVWLATQSELNRYVTMRGAAESFPMRTCQFPGEFHPDVWPDDFMRIYTKLKPSKELFTVEDWHRWSYNMGIWRIVDMDITIAGDAPHRWNCKYTCSWEGFFDADRPNSKEIRL